MNKKIGILTTFGSWDDAYSPCNVVHHQIKALLRHDYEPVLFVLDVFPSSYEIPGCEIRRVIPAVTFEPYQGIVHHKNVPNNFEKDIAKIVPAMEQHFKDVDTFFCHDIIFQDSFLPYNAALRKMLLRKEMKFYHWAHSGPSVPQDLPEPLSFLYTLPPQAKLVYMNYYDVVPIAEMYHTTVDNVRVVHNPIDYRLQKHIHPLVDEIITKYNLNDADVIAVYPLSTTRMGNGGKQLHKALQVLAAIKKVGLKVAYVIPNAHANGENEKLAVMQMKEYARTFGLVDEEMIFTSEIGHEWENGVPHEVVTQIMAFSDLFIFPSVSENAPLVLLEAAMGKNLLVLNEDFSPMKDFVGPNALYFKFDSVRTVTNHPRGEGKYYEDVGKIIFAELNQNKTYKANREIRQKFNIDYIFQRELMPLIYEEWQKETLTPVDGFDILNNAIKDEIINDEKKEVKKHGWW